MFNRRSNESQPRSSPLMRWMIFTVMVMTSLLLAYGSWQGLKHVQNYQQLPLLIRLIFVLCLGVGGFSLSFFILVRAVEQLPENIQNRITPVLFIGPAIALLFWILVIPLFRTIWMSFLDAKGVDWAGLKNYIFVFTDSSMLNSFRNNLLWLLLGSGGCILLGLLIAILADHTSSRFSSIIQSLIFMPMAISMVGASIIWRFVYAFVPAGYEQIGLLNAILVQWGGQPQAFLMDKGVNNLLLIIVFVWMQTGLPVVIFSAAIKTIPEEIIEASRMDGANEWQIVTQISIPYLQNTILAVATIVIVLTLKVFDVVYVMTGGNYGTETIANQFYFEMFRKFNYGHGSAIVVLLVVLILPVVAYNLRRYQETLELK
jgi:alpha-glucoside transport system permease protein